MPDSPHKRLERQIPILLTPEEIKALLPECDADPSLVSAAHNQMRAKYRAQPEPGEDCERPNNDPPEVLTDDEIGRLIYLCEFQASGFNPGKGPTRDPLADRLRAIREARPIAPQVSDEGNVTEIGLLLDAEIESQEAFLTHGRNISVGGHEFKTPEEIDGYLLATRAKLEIFKRLRRSLSTTRDSEEGTDA